MDSGGSVERRIALGAAGVLVLVAAAALATERATGSLLAGFGAAALLGTGAIAGLIAVQRSLAARIGALRNDHDQLRGRCATLLARARAVVDAASGGFGADSSEALEAISKGGQAQEEAVERTASLLAQINASIQAINEEIETLSSATEEASASGIEMGAAVDEVARSAGALHEAVDSSTASIHEIGASIRQVAGSADAVQGMAEETAAAIIQMDRAIGEVSEHVREASVLTERVSHEAETGSHAVSATIEGIESIRTHALGSRQMLENLAERVGEIGEILDVIGGINDETHLLSLNAAIIAAQAGEQGKAFAVVANHVKTLAQRTASSMQEIEKLIRAVQDECGHVVLATDRGVEAVEAGVERSRRAGTALQAIRTSAHDASSRVAEISRAATEQSRNSKHVADAAQRTSEMVQQITQAMSEQQRASEQILESAQSALDVCRQVHRSTEEQRESGRYMHERIESIAARVRSIRENTEQHARASQAVSETVARILEVGRATGERLPELFESLDGPRDEVEALARALAAFSNSDA